MQPFANWLRVSGGKVNVCDWHLKNGLLDRNHPLINLKFQRGLSTPKIPEVVQNTDNMKQLVDRFWKLMIFNSEFCRF